MSDPTAGDPNILKILIATDNHLGVWEKDQTRKKDSFTTFEEIFQLALEHSVDLVLLGGDLFHDNKPSRPTVKRAIDILTKYCLNDNPVTFEVVGGEDNIGHGGANFHNENVNIGLPVFTIHGNHDDPSGEQNLSAVDVLASCNLVNYFGRAALGGSGVGKVEIKPVLVQKGSTKVALYGLGNQREERIIRAFMTPGHVEWTRVQDSQHGRQDDWFNLFVLHQNRVSHSQGTKDALRESHFPPWLDFVVWGHEHECIAEPQQLEGSGDGFQVLQPGSSVATALSEGESQPKHVFILEVLEQEWRIIKHPLQTVRPFIFENVALSDQSELDSEDPKVAEKITEFLEDHMGRMILQAMTRATQRQGVQQQLPLVRLRVDYTGFSTINTQRFGQQFVGKVANPNDMILWHKAPARRTKAGDRRATGDLLGEGQQGSMAEGQSAEGLDRAQMDMLLHEHLREPLQLLPDRELTNALYDFVEKDEKTALADCVRSALAAARAAVQRDDSALPNGNMDDAVLQSLLQRHTEQRQTQLAAEPDRERARSRLPEPSRQPAENGADDMDEDDPTPSTRAPARTAAGRGRGPGARGGRGRGRQTSLADAFGRGRGGKPPTPQRSQISQDVPTQRSAARPRRAAAAGVAATRTAQTAISDDDDHDDAEEELEDADEFEADSVEDESDEDTPMPPRNAVQMLPMQRTPRRLSGASRVGSSRAAAKAVPSPTTGRRQKVILEEDEDAEDVIDVAPVSQARPASQTGRRLPMSFSQGRASQRPGGLIKR